MSRLLIVNAAFVLGLLAAGANADTLPLPQNLSGFSSHDGEVYFAESEAREAYFPLASNFLTQKTQSYCGVASIVMVLNALQCRRPRFLNTRLTVRLRRTTSSPHGPKRFFRATLSHGRA